MTSTSELTADTVLAVTGMTCASCAARIEKVLNRLDGVEATVNYATEKARVAHPATMSADDLVAAVARAGYGATAVVPSTAGTPAVATGEAIGPDAAGALRERLVVSTLLSVPVLAMSMVPALQFDRWQWLALTLASPVVVWGALPFHRAAWTNARHGATTMDTLVSVGTLSAYLWSLYALFVGDAGMTGMRMSLRLTASRGSGHDEIYLEVAAVVTVFLLGGRYFEARAKRRSGAAVRALLELGAKDVAVRRGRAEVRIPIEQLAVDDEFVVRPGERIATDGIVVEGGGAVDTSLLTGESIPVDVVVGDEVTGATTSSSGRLVVRATRIGADTRLAQIGRLVEAAQSGKAEVQRLADRVSAVFVPVVIALAAATLVAWLVTGHGAEAAFTAAVAVLIVACPCALGLATPTALLVGTGRGARLGILIKGPEILESTRRVDTVVLDKTGTVTTGVMTLHAVVVSPGTTEAEALRVVGALESGSAHPIGSAITRAAHDALGELPDVTDFVSHAGLGVQGIVDGHAAVVGRSSLVADWGLLIPADIAAAKDAAESAGRTAVVAAWDGAVRALLVVGDAIRPTSADAVADLRRIGLVPVLLTGDNAAAARAVADAVGIPEVVADVLPEDKVDHVRRLQADGRVVAMVGDGVNDAAALAQSDLGIAMGAGSDVAIEASDITLVRSDLRAVPDAIRLSRRTLQTIKGNLFWAFAYNVAALPLAALGLLNPLLAGAAMALSSVFVVTNSLRLRRFRATSA